MKKKIREVDERIENDGIEEIEEKGKKTNMT